MKWIRKSFLNMFTNTVRIWNKFAVIALATIIGFAAHIAVAEQPSDKDAKDQSQTPSAGMMRYPDVSQEKIVFSYAGDLWVVDRTLRHDL